MKIITTQTLTNSLTTFYLKKFEINGTFTLYFNTYIMSKESKFLTGIIIGAIAGVATGILLATESGEKTRKKIVVKTSELKEDLEAKLNDVSEKIKNIENEDLNSLKDKFFDVKEKNKDQYANIVDKAETIEKDIVSKYKGIKKEAKEKLGSTKNV